MSTENGTSNGTDDRADSSPADRTDDSAPGIGVHYLKGGARAPRARDDAVVERVTAMLREIRDRGEDAVREYSRSLDHHDPASFRIEEAAIEEAIAGVPAEVRSAIEEARTNVVAFAEAQRACLRPLEVEIAPGQIAGHRLVPVDSVGAYVPGGRYPLISSALMSIAVAKVAGVRRVVAMTAPNESGGIHPPTLYAMRAAGADEIYVLGGVQALGAMAYGTLPALAPVDMIVGAGNAYVAEAKRQLFGLVGIDLLAGPTEVLVLADESAEAHTVAVDLLAQAEHGPTSPAVLVTTSRALAEEVLAEIPGVLRAWPTRDVAGVAWNDLGTVAVVDTPATAAMLADHYASEHLQLQVSDPDWYLARLRNYGTAFIGPQTTVAMGDKAMGANHTLPTGGAARYTGGLWVGSFLKVLTHQRLTEAAAVRVGRATAVISRAEGLSGHAASADLRLERYRPGGGNPAGEPGRRE
ncbi:histidinol dehydrogenase [Pseudactinotalea sp. HY160]|uniref:histidinol dehydrogenase n=1 Tax=Pseudactinotalea sp. HY160 TaxID=2654490 RepID=UPI00128E6823|nr:histidinol dehydrogenase [Pseudactinotalea sp. HY160]MPV48823.1 histidinol dehydrogenase [Pseudactinotalea sp. HY160]